MCHSAVIISLIHQIRLFEVQSKGTFFLINVHVIADSFILPSHQINQNQGLSSSLGPSVDGDTT